MMNWIELCLLWMERTLFAGGAHLSHHFGEMVSERNDEEDQLARDLRHLISFPCTAQINETSTCPNDRQHYMSRGPGQHICTKKKGPSCSGELIIYN